MSEDFEHIKLSPISASADLLLTSAPAATQAKGEPMDYVQHMDMTMCDVKPNINLPPYPYPPGLDGGGVTGAPTAGFHGLNSGLSMQDQSAVAANQQLFLSSFSANRGGMGLPHYDYLRPGNSCHTAGGGDMAPTQTTSPSPPPRIYKPCVVCNDKSSGYHYGVSSCEGCKGFFRRSVQKNITYTCQKESNCEINKVTRNRCQHCRLKKCFDKGMSKEAVRNDRKKKTPDSGSVTNNNSSSVKSNEPINHVTDKDQQLIDLILDAHRSTLPGGPTLPNSKNSDHSSPGHHSVSSPVPSTCSNMTGESSDNCRPSPDTTTLDSMGSLSSPPATPGSAVPSPSTRPGWDNVDELNSEGIVKVVEFAKKIPFFLGLTVTDQITLLKAACLEVLILRLTMKYRLSDDTLTFSNGVSINEMEMMKGGFGPLAHTIFKFSAALHEMNLDETEFALLTVICLLSSDRSGLEQSSDVEKVQEPFLVALQHYARQKHLNKPHLFAKLLMKLTDLRSISIKGADKVLHLRQDSTDNIPPLVVEMFDRAENVCIP